jgi:hypothetical protein
MKDYTDNISDIKKYNVNISLNFFQKFKNVKLFAIKNSID